MTFKETHLAPAIETIERGIDTRVHDRRSILHAIGNTPLIKIEGFDEIPENVEIYAKAEWFNPGGSVKDRSAVSMLLDGERSGALTHEKTIIDATSGNTGIAYAMLGSALGYKVTLALPANASEERKQLLHAYGAEVILTDRLAGTDGAQQRAKELAAQSPSLYFYPDQYNNPANWRAHYQTTAPEILRQTSGRITHFVAGLGTTGTFIGTSRALRRANPLIKMYSVGPDAPLHGLEGLKHLPTALVPGIYDPSLADEHLEVSTDEAQSLTRRLAREEGLLVGPSSGAALAACIRLAQRLDSGVIVTIFPDGGARYASDRFWSEGA
jgi:cysteine synthase B